MSTTVTAEELLNHHGDTQQLLLRIEALERRLAIVEQALPTVRLGWADWSSPKPTGTSETHEPKPNGMEGF